MATSSPLILSITTVFALVGVVLVVVAFGTGNWFSYDVNRAEIARIMELTQASRLTLDEFQTNPVYYSRTLGFFQACFPDEVPNGERSGTSFVGLHDVHSVVLEQ